MLGGRWHQLGGRARRAPPAIFRKVVCHVREVATKGGHARKTGISASRAHAHTATGIPTHGDGRGTAAQASPRWKRPPRVAAGRGLSDGGAAYVEQRPERREARGAR
eukprot:7340261-Prymnesium_polylepis.1